MNPLETFGEFSAKLKPTDLMLYAGVGIVLWVLFKDKLGGITKLVTDLVSKASKVTGVSKAVVVTNTNSGDLFFDLVSSWKNMRDLAVKSGCVKAVEAADQMFPYLSPTKCEENKDESVQPQK